MKNIWLIGAGSMAESYNAVLADVNCNYTVIGRGESSAKCFEEHTGKAVVRGGVVKYIDSGVLLPEYAIVATGVELLAETCRTLIGAGVKKILVEKPAGLNNNQILSLHEFAKAYSAKVYVAYNRRFYSSVLKAEEIIMADGGVTSFNFEFTEWSHIIEPLQKAVGVKEKWFLGNSTHVVDLAFFLGGKPDRISTFTSGTLPWHPSASVFAGAGRTEKGALFSYQANWASPGRWSVEIITSKHRLILRPMEQLQIQNIGSVVIEPVEIDDWFDKKYKPGLFRQVEALLNEEDKRLCSIEEQLSSFNLYNSMANYHD